MTCENCKSPATHTSRSGTPLCDEHFKARRARQIKANAARWIKKGTKEHAFWYAGKPTQFAVASPKAAVTEWRKLFDELEAKRREQALTKAIAKVAKAKAA